MNDKPLPTKDHLTEERCLSCVILYVYTKSYVTQRGKEADFYEGKQNRMSQEVVVNSQSIKNYKTLQDIEEGIMKLLKINLGCRR